MRTAYPRIPWNEMIGMRNLMIHDYDEWTFGSSGRRSSVTFPTWSS